MYRQRIWYIILNISKNDSASNISTCKNKVLLCINKSVHITLKVRVRTVIVIQMSEGLIKWSEAEADPQLRQANKESGCGPALSSSSTDFCRSQGFANRASLAPGYCQFSAIKAARHRSLLLLVCIARKNRPRIVLHALLLQCLESWLTLVYNVLSKAVFKKNYCYRS